MEQEDKSTLDELIRGEILLYLTGIYPQGATPTTLRYYLDKRGYEVEESRFFFHVEYLAERGFVASETFPKRLGEPQKIRLVKITGAGINQVEGRPASSSGVRF